MRHVLASLVAASMLIAIPVSAQKAPQTATQFFQEYLAAWAKATSMEPILPFMGKESRGQYEATPKDQRQPMFEMLKAMNPTNVKVVKETKNGDVYTLDLTGVDADKKAVTGTAEIVIEGGAMKLKGESWKL
jgi:hypothetical protein